MSGLHAAILNKITDKLSKLCFHWSVEEHPIDWWTTNLIKPPFHGPAVNLFLKILKDFNGCIKEFKKKSLYFLSSLDELGAKTRREGFDAVCAQQGCSPFFYRSESDLWLIVSLCSADVLNCFSQSLLKTSGAIFFSLTISPWAWLSSLTPLDFFVSWTVDATKPLDFSFDCKNPECTLTMLYFFQEYWHVTTFAAITLARLDESKNIYCVLLVFYHFFTYYISSLLDALFWPGSCVGFFFFSASSPRTPLCLI